MPCGGLHLGWHHQLDLVAEMILDGKELEFYKWEGDLRRLLQNVREKLNEVANKMAENSSQNICKDGTTAEELDSLNNTELFSFMSLRRSEFVKIAGVLKEREESAKAESLKDLYALIAELKDKNGSLENELLSLKGDLADWKKDCMTLRERHILAQEKKKVLMEEVRKETKEFANRRAQDEVCALKQKYLEIEQIENDLFGNLMVYRMNCSMLKELLSSLKIKYLALKVLEENTNTKCKLLEDVQLKLEKARNNRIAEFDSWKDEYSSTETWIRQFLENDPHLMEKGEPATNGE